MTTAAISLADLDPVAVMTTLRKDRQFKAFCPKTVTVNFAFKVNGRGDLLVIDVRDGELQTVQRGAADKAEFVLAANPEIWDKFFAETQELGYQSFWAMYLPQNQIIPAVAQVEGDELKFAQYGPVWRRALDIARHLIVGDVAIAPPPIPDEDHLVGRYTILDLPKWGGKCKVYYEQWAFSDGHQLTLRSGTGSQDIIFLHTAGSDGRQYHGVMNDPRMLGLDLRMTVFDLPSHGRSFPPYDSVPGEHYNSEDRYIEIIGAMIKKLCLKKTIVCGASMAGLICLAVAMRNNEVGAYATIPVQGCEFVDMDRMTWDKHPLVNQSLLVPEFTYGMMSPSAPTRNKDLVWHTYSGQAFGQYAGDLDFYFGGFDYRNKLQKIDTSKIRVAMMTGAYDWSCRPEMSLATAEKIEGCSVDIIQGLGHFPATENPELFVAHLLGAISFVNAESV